MNTNGAVDLYGAGTVLRTVSRQRPPGSSLGRDNHINKREINKTLSQSYFYLTYQLERYLNTTISLTDSVEMYHTFSSKSLSFLNIGTSTTTLPRRRFSYVFNYYIPSHAPELKAVSHQDSWLPTICAQICYIKGFGRPMLPNDKADELIMVLSSHIIPESANGFGRLHSSYWPTAKGYGHSNTGAGSRVWSPLPAIYDN